MQDPQEPVKEPIQTAPTVTARLAIRIVALLFLVAHLALAAEQWADFHSSRMLGSDHLIYTLAVQRAWSGSDPYLPHHIGWGYLYPPPSLLLLRATEWLSPAAVTARSVWIAASILAVLLAVLLCRRSDDSRPLYTAALLLTSAGVIESTRCGQINGFVVLLVVGFSSLWHGGRRGLAAGVLATATCLKTTPLLLTVMFLRRRDWKWIGVFVGIVVLWCGLAAWLIPAAHVNRSFLESLRWSAQQYFYWGWNYSLSVSVPVLLHEWGKIDVTFVTFHWTKLMFLALLLVAAWAVFIATDSSTAAGDMLFVVSNVCMVLAPNLVWLAHAALLIPAYWFFLARSRDVGLMVLAALSLLAFQLVRPLQTAALISPAAPTAVAQLLLLAACIRLVLLTLRRRDGAGLGRRAQRLA